MWTPEPFNRRDILNLELRSDIFLNKAKAKDVAEIKPSFEMVIVAEDPSEDIATFSFRKAAEEFFEVWEMKRVICLENN